MRTATPHGVPNSGRGGPVAGSTEADMAVRTPTAPTTGRALHIAVGISVAVVIAGSAAQLVDHGFHLGIRALDSSRDGGAFGIVGDLASLSAAGAAWLVLARERPVRPDVVALPPLLTFVAVDKVTRLHDHVPHYLVFYAPVLLAALACLALATRRAKGPARRLLGVGLMLLAGSFALHLGGERLLQALALDGTGWPGQIKAVVKHGLEVEGWFLVTLGLATRVLNRRSGRS
jgi:hypothetical protein